MLKKIVQKLHMHLLILQLYVHLQKVGNALCLLFRKVDLNTGLLEIMRAHFLFTLILDNHVQYPNEFGALQMRSPHPS